MLCCLGCVCVIFFMLGIFGSVKGVGKRIVGMILLGEVGRNVVEVEIVK